MARWDSRLSRLNMGWENDWKPKLKYNEVRKHRRGENRRKETKKTLSIHNVRVYMSKSIKYWELKWEKIFKKKKKKTIRCEKHSFPINNVISFSFGNINEIKKKKNDSRNIRVMHSRDALLSINRLFNWFDSEFTFSELFNIINGSESDTKCSCCVFSSTHK